MTTFEYAVTYEFETRAPLTHRGTVEASSAAPASARAHREARKVLHPRGWSSCVCVLSQVASGGPSSGGDGNRRDEYRFPPSHTPDPA